MIAQENRDLFFGYYGVRRHEAVELTFGHIHQFEDRWEVIMKRETATRNADARTDCYFGLAFVTASRI